MIKLFKFIGKVFKFLLNTLNIIRLLVVNLFFLFVIGVLYHTFMQYQQDPTAQPIEDVTPSALVLNLSGPIVEQRTYVNPMDSLSDSVLGRDMPKENVLFEVAETIRHAADDDSISGLVLVLKQMPETNLTKLRYIAKAINEFKASGKPVFASSDFYNQSQYYLASYADKIMLAPDGGVLLKGYSSYTLYYKELLEKLDVTTHVFRVGTYKSAVEPFLRTDMSDEAKQSASRWLSQLWGAYVDDVATNRQIDAEVLNPSMESFLADFESVGGDLAALAKKLDLVDMLATRDQRLAVMIDAFGSDDHNSYNHVSYYSYLNRVKMPPQTADSDIAIVVARGAIMDGKEQRGNVGGDTTAAQLRAARLDDDVKAVVLRVDSPGGSAFASEVIRNEVVSLRAAGKPVVVSMSSLAASGGYWISMNADKIVAQPTTLTGSIGIFSVITTFENSFKSLGIHTDGVGTSPFSGAGVATGLNKGAQAAMQMGIEHGYGRFTGLVADARDMDIAAVDAVAQGRVWTGVDAKEHGLVDEIGDFDFAVELAAELAELDEYNLSWVQEPLTPAQEFFLQFFGDAQSWLGADVQQWIPAALLPQVSQIQSDLRLVNQLNDPRGVYAMCLTCSVE
jgi:protease-4